MFASDLRRNRLVGQFEHFGLFMELVSLSFMNGKSVRFEQDNATVLSDEGIFPITVMDNETYEVEVFVNWREVQSYVISLSEGHVGDWFCTYAMGEDYHAHKNFQTLDGKEICVIMNWDDVGVYYVENEEELADREDYFLDKIFQKRDNYLLLFEKPSLTREQFSKKVQRKEAKANDLAKTLFSEETLAEIQEKWVNFSQFEY